MTISSSTNSWSYTGNGVTLAFAYTNRIFSTADLKVYVDGTLKTLTTHYTVSGADVPTGGNVTFLVAPAVDAVVLILRDVQPAQDAAFPALGTFNSTLAEKALDKLTVGWQQLKAGLARTIRLSDTSSFSGSLVLPEPEAGKAIGWNSDATALTNDPADFASSVSTVAASAAAAASSAVTAAARAADAASSASASSGSADTSAASAVAAAASEANALLYAARMSGSSTSSVSIGTGSKSFTTQADKFFAPGAWVLITSDAAPATNYMHGQVTAYSGTALTVDVTNIGGSGTLADWTIRVAGTRGATGATGATGAQGPQGDPGLGTVASVTAADASIIVGGTAADPTISRAALSGDVTASAGSNSTAIANDAVTYAKMQNVSAASRLLGRGSASGSGDPEEITLGAGLSLSGTALSSTVTGLLTPVVTVFTASGTFTKNANTVFATVEVVAGGGGGAGAGNASYGGSGGGGGGYSRKSIAYASLGATETVTVGTGGAGGTSGSNNGSAGNTSSFGTHCSATGGSGGLVGGSAAGAAGGVGSSGDINIKGQGSIGPIIIGGASDRRPFATSGGSSVLGGGAAAPSGADAGSSTAGNAGGAYGGGGSGAVSYDGSAKAGGAGADGVVIVTEYRA